MGIVDLRADALAASFDAFGQDVELLVGGSITESKVILGIWTQPTTQTELGGFDLQADRPSYILAVKKVDAPRITRGDRLRAKYAGRMQGFRVDGPVEIFSDHFRLQLVPDDTAHTARGGGSGKKEVPDRKPHRPKPSTLDPHGLKDHE